MGAEPRAVAGMILRQGGMVTLVGVAVGLTAAITGSRLIQSLLYGVGPRDPVIFVVTTLPCSASRCWRAGCPLAGRPGSARSRRCGRTERPRSHARGALAHPGVEVAANAEHNPGYRLDVFVRGVEVYDARAQHVSAADDGIGNECLTSTLHASSTASFNVLR